MCIRDRAERAQAEIGADGAGDVLPNTDEVRPRDPRTDVFEQSTVVRCRVTTNEDGSVSISVTSWPSDVFWVAFRDDSAVSSGTGTMTVIDSNPPTNQMLNYTVLVISSDGANFYEVRCGSATVVTGIDCSVTVDEWGIVTVEVSGSAPIPEGIVHLSLIHI